MKKQILSLLLMLFSMSVVASDEQITTALKNLGAKDIKISSSPLPGMKTAITDQGIIYVSDDGKYVLYGNLYQLTDKGAVNLSNKMLFEQVEQLAKQMIVYPAKNEKYRVTVFMDISCHYCHILHQQIKEYNDLGITVRYLAFPRGGLESQTAQQMESIWTSKDPNFALDEAEKGNLPKELKTPQIIAKHYQLGVQYGVNGTPSIILPTGELLGGYIPAPELLKILQESK